MGKTLKKRVLTQKNTIVNYFKPINKRKLETQNEEISKKLKVVDDCNKQDEKENKSYSDTPSSSGSILSEKGSSGAFL